MMLRIYKSPVLWKRIRRCLWSYNTWGEGKKILQHFFLFFFCAFFFYCNAVYTHLRSLYGCCNQKYLPSCNNTKGIISLWSPHDVWAYRWHCTEWLTGVQNMVFWWFTAGKCLEFREGIIERENPSINLQLLLWRAFFFSEKKRYFFKLWSIF